MPFDISYKDKILSGECKVTTCTNLDVEIVKWDHPGKYPIVGLATLGLDHFPTALYFTEEGVCNREQDTKLYDLHLECDDPELTKFEQCVHNVILNARNHQYLDDLTAYNSVHGTAEVLLNMAADELVRRGYELTQYSEAGKIMTYRGKPRTFDSNTKIGPENRRLRIDTTALDKYIVEQKCKTEPFLRCYSPKVREYLINHAAREAVRDEITANEFLRNAGIIDENGNLAEPYRDKKLGKFGEKLAELIWDEFDGERVTEYNVREFVCLHESELLDLANSERNYPVYKDTDTFESGLDKAWKAYDNGYRNVDKFEDNYIECVFAKGFREGYIFRSGKGSLKFIAKKTDEEPTE